MGSTRLIGRDAQLAVLREALVSASTGATRCVLVTGEAGIGKTRLVAEVTADVDGGMVMTGHGARMSTGEIPFGVLADSLRDLAGRHGPEVLAPSEREALAPLLPGSASTMRNERVQILSAFVDLLERLAHDRLLVWVVEDLHWADSATRDVVNLAARTLRGRFLLIATVRTDDPDRSEAEDAALTSYVSGLARAPGCLLLPLNRLSVDQVRDQLAGLITSRLTPGATERIERLSDGVPFVVEELAAAAGHPEVATASAVASHRLLGLSTEARRLVDAAAVGDGHLRISLVEEVLDATPEELDAVVAEAVRASILVTDSGADSLGFRHALLREAADRAMGPGARRSWHRRWAEVLEATPGVLAADPAVLAVAEHWHHARDVRRALAATVRALPAAERICRPDEEGALWTRVLRAYGLVDDAADVAGMTLREALARGLLGCQFASHDQWTRFLAAVPRDRLDSAESAAFEAASEEEVGKGEANLLPQQPLRVAAAAFENSQPDLLAILVWSMVGSQLTEDLAVGEDLVQRAAAAARELGLPRAILFTAGSISYRAQVTGDAEAAVAMLRDALAECAGESWEGVLMVMGNLAWCETVLGNHEQADAVVRDALSRLRHPHLSTNVWEHLVENATAGWIMTGQWQRARELLDESAPWWRDDVRTSNARADELDLLMNGDADVGRWWDRVDTPAPGGAPRVAVRELLALHSGSVGDLTTLRRVLAPVWSDASFLLSDDQLWRSVLLAARCEADASLTSGRDDREEAAAHVRTIAALAAKFRRYGVLGEVWPLDLAAQLDRFHGRDARPALWAALEGWQQIGHVPDAAITYLSLAEAEASHGDRESARAHLAAGRAISTDLGAGPMLARADRIAERFGLGSRERRGNDVLTDREAEVLALLAQGRTNAEIAATLFMSPKTASVHVSRIITKLGATNRTEAAAIARRQGLITG